MSNLFGKIKKIAKNPGIYQFLDKNGKIIYIGKSVNLKNRINSYFSGKSKLNFAKQKMVKQIYDIKTIITNNETESIILETTLIKKHQPKYNILMKDGKNHIYIKITNELIPKIIKTRISPSLTKKSIGTYFGPYISTNYVNNVLKIIKKIFGYRSCNLKFEDKSFPYRCFDKTSVKNKTSLQNHIQISSKANNKIPCMDYYIKTCAGPCLLNKENIDKYLENIENIKIFFKGNNKKIIQNLENKMQEKANNLEFEEAQKLKENIESIKALNVYQIVREGVKGNFYVINYLEKFGKTFIGMIKIKDSKITGLYNYEIENKLEEDKETIVKNYIINNLLTKNGEITFSNILLTFPIKLEEEIFKNIKIEIPKIGVKKELLDLCYKNIYEYSYKSHLNSLSTKGFSKKTMQNILELTGLKQINKNIIFECNDISHISGNYTVASRSIIENGKSNKSKYKKFKIKTLENQKIDDFGSMKEIITRRLKEIEKIKIIPDLIIIDGGKGQLSSVLNIIEKYKQNINNTKILDLINNLQIISIAKKEEELFIKGKQEKFDKIILNKESNELRLIQKIRDEAHRFAITFNRDSRIKGMKKNILESLPGFGPKTRSKILKKYGNIEKLQKIPKEELLKIINKTQLETLENHGIV